MNAIRFLFPIYLLGGLLHAQDVSMPTDILQSMKTSLEAAGGGALNFGPMGVLGNLSGQFGVKINKEQSSSGNTAKLVKNRRSISRLHPTGGEMRNKLDNSKRGFDLKNIKNCFGIPIYVPVINIVTNPPSSTTSAAGPDIRGDSTTTVAA